MANTEINLLHRRVGPDEEGLAHLESSLKIAAWWSLIALLGIGIIVGTIFVVLSTRIQQLERGKAQLIQQINAQSVKEGILLSLKQRTIIAGKALDAARPWGNLFPMLTQITDSANYRSLTIDDAGKVSVQLTLTSVDDAVIAVSNIIALTQQGTVKLPQMLVFTASDDGSVQMGMSFVPVL